MGRVFSVGVAAIVSVTIGCAQLAGIDQTSGSDGGNPNTGNSLRFQRMSIGTTVQLSDLDLTGLMATYLVANDTNPSGFDRISAAPSGAGTWAADLRAPAPVEYTFPDVPMPLPRMYSFPNKSLSGLFGILEHPNRTPAQGAAMLTVSATLNTPIVAGESFQTYVVGPWTVRGFTGLEAPVGATAIGPVGFAYSTMGSISGRPAPFDHITPADTFFVLRYQGAGLVGFGSAAAFDQNGNDMVPVTVGPITQGSTLDVKVDPPTLVSRYTAVRPAVASLAMNWSLNAAPGYKIASNAGPQLQAGALMMTDVGVLVPYGNPFTDKGWNTVLTLATSENRVYTPPGTATPVTLYAGMNQFIEPNMPGFALTLPAGLPELISIDGKPLSTDGQTITPPSKFVEVSFVADNPNATLFNLQVFDLLPSVAGTTLEYHFVFSAAGTETKTGSSEAVFHVPPEIFQTGHRYTMRAFCTFGGYPTLADGHLENRELPLSQSFFDSGVFTVMP